MKVWLQNFKINKAFTLIELIIVIAVMGILASTIFTLTNSASKQYQHQSDISDADNDVRIAMSAITSRIHQNDYRDEAVDNTFPFATSYKPESSVIIVEEDINHILQPVSKPVDNVIQSSGILRIHRADASEYIILKLENGRLVEYRIDSGLVEDGALFGQEIDASNKTYITQHEDLINSINFSNFSTDEIYRIKIDISYNKNKTTHHLTSDITLRSDIN